jgi:hypothetical protein
MRYALALFVAVCIQALLLAFNVYFIVTTGGAISWAAATFITVMLVITVVNYLRVTR